MKKVLVVVSVIILFASCSSKQPKSLFDGTTMNGWRTFKNMPNNSWEVIDGTLHCKPFIDGADNQRADLITVDQYGDFELAFDWKISAQGNSGVIYRATEEFDVPYASGPEFQILDDEGYPGDKKPEYLTAANYDMQAVEKKKLNPTGEWNSSKIVAKGNHIEHWLNGEKVLEYELYSDAWKAQVASHKWKDFPGYGLSKSGYIDLQDHGNEVWFRNITILPL